jgi:hypothetical protein
MSGAKEVYNRWLSFNDDTESVQKYVAELEEQNSRIIEILKYALEFEDTSENYHQWSYDFRNSVIELIEGTDKEAKG